MGKKLSILLVSAIFALLSVPSIAWAASDIQDHWARQEIEQWMGYGVIGGYEDGTVRPDASITRAEFATLVDRLMRYQEEAENAFPDVADDWYTGYVLRAAAAGIMTGDSETGAMRPSDPISRQEACVVLCRAFGLDTEAFPDAGFADQWAIADWAEASVNAMKASGLVSGIDGSFSPTRSITRAEVVKILDNAFADVFYEPGVHSADVDGNLVVNVSGVTFGGGSVSGDVVISEGVSDGEVRLENVNIGGSLVVRADDVRICIGEGCSVPDVRIEAEGVSIDRPGDPSEATVSSLGELEHCLASEQTERVLVKKGTTLLFPSGDFVVPSGKTLVLEEEAQIFIGGTWRYVGGVPQDAEASLTIEDGASVVGVDGNPINEGAVYASVEGTRGIVIGGLLGEASFGSSTSGTAPMEIGGSWHVRGEASWSVEDWTSVRQAEGWPAFHLTLDAWAFACMTDFVGEGGRIDTSDYNFRPILASWNYSVDGLPKSGIGFFLDDGGSLEISFSEDALGNREYTYVLHGTARLIPDASWTVRSYELHAPGGADSVRVTEKLVVAEDCTLIISEGGELVVEPGAELLEEGRIES